MAIKVFIQTKKFSGGPRVFRERIAKALNKFKDIEVTRDETRNFDIELSVVRLISTHRKPQIIRLDGCYFTPNKLKNNKVTKEAIKRSNSVVYQSSFSKAMCDYIVRPAKVPTYILHNGIDLNYVRKIKPNPKIEPGSFVAVAKWRVNKRPKSLIRGFMKADT